MLIREGIPESDLDDGRYIQNSIESVFLDMDGNQLLVSELNLV